jgi:hypothetical protein
MTKCLIKATGWIGDSFFALPLPQKLKNEFKFDIVDFLSYRPQPLLLLKQNKFIDNVFLEKCDESTYDQIFEMPGIADKSIPPTIQFQNFCKIKNQDISYEIQTYPEHDTIANILISGLDKTKKIVTYQGDWFYRRWNISKEEHLSRKFNTADVRPGAFSSRPGNIKYILTELKKQRHDCIFIEISPFHSKHVDARGYCTDPYRYSLLASIIKGSHLFLGAEGGLSNLAAGLGIKTIITTCHLYLMFGEQGVFSQTTKEIQLGPAKLFPGKGHIHLDPYLTDEGVLEELCKLV